MGKVPLNFPSLVQLAASVLRDRAGERMTIEGIASSLASIHAQHFREKERKLGSHAALVAQLTREIYAQRSSILKRHADVAVDTSRRPLRLFVEAPAAGAVKLAVVSTAAKKVVPNAASDGADGGSEVLGEMALYEPLQRYLYSEERIVSKRINETTSSNKRGRNGNRWLHPDVVGMLVPGQGWSQSVRDCSMALPTRKAKLIAIEVKLRLTAGDVRESFFQTVSNSLWANRGYLAAVEIKGKETREELETLCALHGVGYISIDPIEPSESRITIPAREREEVDWASVNRIAEENEDFRKYLDDVLNYLQTGKLVPRLWQHTGKA